jgi:hypothetical protein
MRALVLSLAEWADPAVLEFGSEANERLLDFERTLEPKLGVGGELDHLADWGSKLAGAVVRVAGLLHLAGNLKTGYRERVRAETFDRAEQVGDYFLGHAIAVHRFMGAEPVIEDARVIIRWLATRQRGDLFSKRDAHRALEARFPKSADLDAPLTLLDDRGWIRRLPDPPSRPDGGRPPSPKFEVHPDVTDTTDTRHGSVSSVSSVDRTRFRERSAEASE